MADPTKFLSDGPGRSRYTLVLAHGAGAPMDSPFMDAVARDLGSRGLRVVRFEFPYMERRRREGRRRPPDRQPVLEQCWRDVVACLGDPRRLVVGGKSLGGRIASLIADEAGVAGLVCLGYPFHPPGRPERLRTAHLRDLRTPALIVQGERDPFGTPDEIAGYGLASGIRIVFLQDGDHSFKPRVRSGETLEGHLARTRDEIVRFVSGL